MLCPSAEGMEGLEVGVLFYSPSLIWFKMVCVWYGIIDGIWKSVGPLAPTDGRVSETKTASLLTVKYPSSDLFASAPVQWNRRRRCSAAQQKQSRHASYFKRRETHPSLITDAPTKSQRERISNFIFFFFFVWKPHRYRYPSPLASRLGICPNRGIVLPR